MAAIIFDPAAFRLEFTAFSNVTTYPDATLERYFRRATLYINKYQGGRYSGGLDVDQLTESLYLMTAHLLAINDLILAGQVVGVTTGATVDKVSITLEAPPNDNQWQYWLMSTPYGQQLYALLSVVGAGGFYFGGRRELGAFKRVW